MLKQHFLPEAELELISWLKNFNEKIPMHGKDLGLKKSELKIIIANNCGLIEEIEKTYQGTNTTTQQIAIKNRVKLAVLNELNCIVQRIKFSEDSYESIVEDLGIDNR